MAQQSKDEVPEYLVKNGEGLAPFKEKTEAPVQEEMRPQPQEEKLPQATPSAGSPPGPPTGGDVQESAGGKTGAAMEEKRPAREIIVPPGSGQTGKEKVTESGSSIMAKSLGPQLGSSPQFLTQQQIDERKMAVLNDLTQTSLNYLAFRGYIDKVRFWAWFVDSELVTSQAIGGLARRHILQAIAAAGGAQIQETAQKPNVLARNIWERTWREKAAREGKTPEQ